MKSFMSELRENEGGRLLGTLEKGKICPRLPELGLRPGQSVMCLLRSPLGGMGAYRTEGRLIAVRDSDCSSVIVEKNS